MDQTNPMKLCRACGTLNRVDSTRAAARCGSCRARLDAAAEAPAGGGGGSAAPPRPGTEAGGRTIAVNDQTFRLEVLESDLPVLLDCWAAWCGPCHMLAPALDALASQHAGRLKVCKLNVEACPRAASELQVMALPTLIAYRHGLPLGRQMGVQSADRIAAWLRGLGML